MARAAAILVGALLLLGGLLLIALATLTGLEATHVNLRALLPGSGDAVYVRSTVVGGVLAAAGAALFARRDRPALGRGPEAGVPSSRTSSPRRMRPEPWSTT